MKTIHLINPMWNDYGGSEHRTAALYAILKGVAKTHVWSEFKPTQTWQQKLSIKQIRTHRLNFPFNGTIVFVGSYYWVGNWIKLAKPRRIIQIYNIDQPSLLSSRLELISKSGKRNVELIYSSDKLRQKTLLPGEVQDSFFDMNRFHPVQHRREEFVVGRLSRTPSKNIIQTTQRFIEG